MLIGPDTEEAGKRIDASIGLSDASKASLAGHYSALSQNGLAQHSASPWRLQLICATSRALCRLPCSFRSHSASTDSRRQQALSARYSHAYSESKMLWHSL